MSPVKTDVHRFCIFARRNNDIVDLLTNQLVCQKHSDLVERMHPIVLALATPADSSDLFAWRNDIATRQASKNAEPISWDSHVRWFAAALASPDRKIYLGRIGSQRIGSIRFDRIDPVEEVFLVSISVAPAERGRGLGLALLRAGILAEGRATLEAEIATSNLASRRIFESCGFKPTDEINEPKFLKYRRLPSQAS